MDYKICEQCALNKPLIEFQRHRKIYKKDKNSDKEWYYYPICKECNKGKKSEQDKKYREAHKEEKALTDREYRNQNKDKITVQRKKFYIDNRQFILNKSAASYKEKVNDPLFVESERIRGREKARKRKPIRNRQRQKRRKVDPTYRLRSIVSKSVWGALKLNGGSKAGNSFTQYFSYSMEDLKLHLESLFEPWMNWNNQGSYKVSEWDDNDQTTWRWNIDHIIPHSKFKYTSMEDQTFKDCWALSNLRPYSAKQNIIDGDK